MAKISTSVTTTNATQIAIARKPRDADFYLATITLAGTFGGGTMKLQMSPDGGTTKVDLEDQSGTVWSATANRTVNIQLGTGGALNDQIILYALNTGGTGISVIATVFDNL